MGAAQLNLLLQRRGELLAPILRVFFACRLPAAVGRFRKNVLRRYP